MPDLLFVFVKEREGEQSTSVEKRMLNWVGIQMSIAMFLWYLFKEENASVIKRNFLNSFWFLPAIQ